MPGKHHTGIQTMDLSQSVKAAQNGNMEQQRQEGEGGRGRGGRGGGGEQGGREYVMNSALPANQPASQPTSGTLMTIMSCHTSCRASQQILPLSLPFSNQCHWSVPGVKGQERINRGRVADAAGGEGADSRQINDTPRLPLLCYDYSFAINPTTLREYVSSGRNSARGGSLS